MEDPMMNLVENLCQNLKSEEDRMMKWFSFTHLPEHLQSVSKPFHDLAENLCQNLQSGPERTVALRKLLESKDAAVRAYVHPGN